MLSRLRLPVATPKCVVGFDDERRCEEFCNNRKDNRYGSRGVMCVTIDEKDTEIHPDIWSEVNHDGMLGLPKIYDWCIPNEG